MTSSNEGAGSIVSGIIRPTEPGPEVRRLEVFIGRWITEGHVLDEAGAAAVRIQASDVYEWAPGGFFVIHPAYGLIGGVGGGGLEVIGYDSSTQQYWSQFFDSQGNVGTSELLLAGGHWIWQRDTRVHCGVQRGREDPDCPPRAPQRGRHLGAFDGSRADQSRVTRVSSAMHLNALNLGSIPHNLTLEVTIPGNAPFEVTGETLDAEGF